MKLVKTIMSKNYIWLPMITLFCLAGFIGSLLFPNKVLDTYPINVKEEANDSARIVPLGNDNAIIYELDTIYIGKDQGEFCGIQVYLYKANEESIQGNLVLSAYIREEGQTQDEYSKNPPISVNRYALTTMANNQDVFLPIQNEKEAQGKIALVFEYEPSEQEMQKSTQKSSESIVTAASVGLWGNKNIPSQTSTIVKNKGEYKAFDGSIKAKYVYAKNGYPFLYDFRLWTFLFFAVTMSASFTSLNLRKKKRSEL